jgi:uncharacterized protein (UPF0332 family)
VLPRDLLLTAADLVNSSKGKPRQAHLRRAVSTAYYAMFHTLAQCCADLLIGGPGSKRSKPAWSQVYRALEHGFAKSACSNKMILAKFPQEIQDFANMFVQMQIKRHDADYNPTIKVFKSAILTDISIVNAAIKDFDTAPLEDRRAFAALVMFKQRN